MPEWTFKGRRPIKPVNGDIHYDDSTLVTKAYVDNDWVMFSSANHNGKLFYWLTNTKVPYVKLLDQDWVHKNITDIARWLKETQTGDYLPALGAIVFNDEASATLFRLTWT